MQTVNQGVRSLSLILDLNWDRMVSTGAIVASLALAAWLAGFAG